MRLIDADALVEAIKDYPYGFRGMIVCDIAKQPTYDKACIIGVLEELPTIEPKRGKWVEHIMDYWCSECGGRVQKEQAKMYSKCPYCGASMERSEE